MQADETTEAKAAPNWWAIAQAYRGVLQVIDGYTVGDTAGHMQYFHHMIQKVLTENETDKA